MVSAPPAADRVAVIIVNYQSYDELRTCLTSIGRARGRFQVVVVDHATNHTQADAVSARFPEVLLLRKDVNEGFAAAYASKGTPSGGVKQSGVGARHGDNGLLKYTDVQNLAVVKKLGVMGVQPGQAYEKYAKTTLKSLAIMRKTGLR